MSGFPSHWLGPLSLGQVSVVSSGYWGDSDSNEKRDVPVSVVRNGDISRAGALTGAASRFFSEREASRSHTQSGDVLFTSSGDIGKTYLCGSENLHVSNFVKCLRPNADMLEPRYLYYLCQSPAVRDLIPRHSGGTTLVNLHKSFFEEPWIWLPPIDEQRRTVEILEDHLSKLDAALRCAANVRVSTAKLARLFLATRIDGAESERRPLSDLVREGMRNGHSARASTDGTGIRTLTLTAVTMREFTEANSKLTVADPDKVRDLWLEPGDILVERSNTPELVGTSALYEGPTGWAIFPDLLIRVRVNETLVMPRFLDLTLQSPASRTFLTQRAKGLAGSMPKIDQGTLAALPIPVPPLSVQQQIVDEADSLSAACKRVDGSASVALGRGMALRRSLLAAAVSGQLTKEPFHV